MSEREVKQTTRVESKSDKTDRKLRPRCTFCKYYGHRESECRKKTQTKENENAKSAKSQTPLPAEVTKPQVTCYGCGTPGYIRSTCPTCRPAKSNDQMTSSSFTFNETTTSLSDQANRPMLAISVQDQTGLVCLDTGSRGSIAGAKLHQVLTTQGYKPRRSELTIRLADGEPRHVSAHIFDVDITVNHRTVPTTLIAIPELPNSKTLLGVDFLKKANMVLDLTKDEWYFSDEPDNRHRFLSESADSDGLVNYVSNETLILGDEEGKHLDDNQRTRMNLLLAEYADVFSPSDKPTTFAEHTVQLTDETPIAVPPYRMTPEKKRYLGAVLLQGESPMERPVEYASRLLTAPEKNFLPQITPHLQRLSEVLATARENQESRQDASKIQADRRRRDAPQYDTGDQVLVHVHALSKAASSYTSKFAPRQDGPYLIRKQMSPTTYQVATLKDPRTPVGVYHASALTRYVPGDKPVTPVRPIRGRGRPRKQPRNPEEVKQPRGVQPPPRRRGRPPRHLTSGVPPEAGSVTPRGRV